MSKGKSPFKLNRPLLRKKFFEQMTTLKAFAKKAGVTTPTVSNLLTGKCETVQPVVINKIAKALNMEPSELILWEDDDG